VQVFGDGVFTEDWDWDEISQVYDRLIQAKDINLDTTIRAHYRGEAVMREVDIKGLIGTILVPMNCGQDLVRRHSNNIGPGGPKCLKAACVIP